MKILLCIAVFCISGGAGYIYKKMLVDSKLFLEYILEFENFCDSNITLFKNNIVEIIDKFLANGNKKTDKFKNVFLKNNEIYSFDKNVLKKYLKDENLVLFIENYLQNLGKNEYEFEKEKNKNFENYIKAEIEKSQKICEQKGSLFFKLSLALGAVLCIILW